jgi:hypothetical protein
MKTLILTILIVFPISLLYPVFDIKLYRWFIRKTQKRGLMEKDYDFLDQMDNIGLLITLTLMVFVYFYAVFMYMNHGIK